VVTVTDGPVDARTAGRWPRPGDPTPSIFHLRERIRGQV